MATNVFNRPELVIVPKPKQAVPEINTASTYCPNESPTCRDNILHSEQARGDCTKLRHTLIWTTQSAANSRTFGGSKICQMGQVNREAPTGGGLEQNDNGTGTNQISLAVMVYLKLSGSRLSRRPLASSTWGYIRKPSSGPLELGNLTS